jgi:hypothetical protein
MYSSGSAASFSASVSGSAVRLTVKPPAAAVLLLLLMLVFTPAAATAPAVVCDQCHQRHGTKWQLVRASLERAQLIVQLVACCACCAVAQLVKQQCCNKVILLAITNAKLIDQYCDVVSMKSISSSAALTASRSDRVQGKHCQRVLMPNAIFPFSYVYSMRSTTNSTVLTGSRKASSTNTGTGAAAAVRGTAATAAAVLLLLCALLLLLLVLLLLGRVVSVQRVAFIVFSLSLPLRVPNSVHCTHR